jgi:hypothetical protein
LYLSIRAVKNVIDDTCSEFSLVRAVDLLKLLAGIPKRNNIFQNIVNLCVSVFCKL